MMPAPVVSNTSPLIALERIGQLDLMQKLFSTVIIPPAVAREFLGGAGLQPWLTEQPLSQPIDPGITRTLLGPGEREAISLALELGASWVILDDRPARRLAQALGLRVVGTLGILLAGKRHGFLPAVKPSLDALMNSGFRVADDLYERVLTDAGEGP